MTEASLNPSSSLRVGSLTVHVALRSDVGRVRNENQDFGVVTTEQEYRPEKGHLMIVADGMGGHRGGATASRMGATIVKTEYLADGGSDVGKALRAALEKANVAIFEDSQSKIELRGMGTTCSVLVIKGREAWVAHVGDSRIYFIRGGAIKQLTDDHSLVATMVREGLLTSREAEIHPRRNVLQRSMGVMAEMEADIIPPFEVRSGDTFVACSDGLHGLVKPEEILELAAQPVEKAVDELVDRALSRGAPDNVTVIVARLE
jgi:serine/threonine protein phosphatase PrpC